MNRKTLLVLFLSATLGATPLLHAQEQAPQRTLGSVERSHASQARALLDQAVLTFQAKGPEQALAAFNDRSGEFVRGQYYIFVLGEDGTMQASSGPSASLVGLNVGELKDASGKPFMRELLDKSARQESGEVEYKWLNPADNKVENKISQFRKVGDHVLCVGYYIPAPRPNMPRRCSTAPLGRSRTRAPRQPSAASTTRAAASSSRTNTSSPSASTTAVTAPAAARRTWWVSMCAASPTPPASRCSRT